MFWMLAAFFCRLSASAWVLARTPSTLHLFEHHRRDGQGEVHFSLLPGFNLYRGRLALATDERHFERSRFRAATRGST